jgi:hypothetical protein
MTYENRDSSTTTIFSNGNETDVNPWELLENLIENLPIEDENLTDELLNQLYDLKERSFSFCGE